MRLPLVPDVLQPDAVKRRIGTSVGLVSALASGTRQLAPLVLREVPHVLGSVVGGVASVGASALGHGPRSAVADADAPGTPPLGAGQGSTIELERDSALPPSAAAAAPPPPAASAAPPPPAPAASMPPAAVELGAPGAADEAVQEAIADRVPPGGQVPVPAHDELPLPDYDHLTLPALRARIRRLDLEGLLQVRAYEVAHAHRLPVLTTLDNRAAKLRAEPRDS